MTPLATKRWRWRWLAEFVARERGYFWLPCAICGESYAGFEWGESLIREWGRSNGTCARAECRAETKRRNLAWVAANAPAPPEYGWLEEHYRRENAS